MENYPTATHLSCLPSLALGLEHVNDADHVILRDTFGDGDDERDLGLDGLLDGFCGYRRRDEDGAESS